MHKIEHINYHYYYTLEEFLDKQSDDGFEVIQIIRIESSGDNELMHRATILLRKINK